MALEAQLKPVRLFVLITMDALRGDRVGYAGYPRPTSPELDRLSEEALVFENAFSLGPTTSVAFPAIMSSTYPLDLPGGSSHFVEGRPYLLEFLSQSNVRTDVIHSHPVLSVSFGFGKGVENWLDIEVAGGGALRKRVQSRRAFRRKAQAVYDTFRFLPLWETLWKPMGLFVYQAVDRHLIRFHRQSSNTPAYASAQELTEHAVAKLSQLRDENRTCFLWVHYLEPHGPYFPSPEFRNVGSPPWSERMRRHVNRNYERWMQERKLDLSKVPLKAVSSLYDALIRTADAQIGRLLDRLRESGMWDETAVMFTADHGEEFGEHGGLCHGMKLYREGTHVPLMLRVPGVAPRRIAAPVSLLDLCPTVADSYGVPSHGDWRGQSLLRFSDGESAEKARVVISECMIKGEPAICATDSDLRLLYHGADRWEAFSFQDRLDSVDLYAQSKDTEKLKALRSAIESRLAHVQGHEQQGIKVADEGLKRRLKALGYFD